MKKYMIITALCLLKVGSNRAAEKKTIDFIIEPCSEELIKESDFLKNIFGLKIFLEPCLKASTKAGELIGVITYMNKKKKKESSTYISYLGVSKVFQGQGIGHALITAVENKTLCSRIDLSSLTEALQFYRRLGFNCDQTNYCSKPCNQSSLPKPAQTSKLGSQNPKSHAGVQ